MSSAIRHISLLLVGILVAGAMFAQDQRDPRKWSSDPRATSLNPSGTQTSMPQAIPNFENPNKDYRTVVTPQGTFSVAPNIRVHPSTTFWQSELPITRHPTNANIMYGSSNAVKFGPLFISEGMYLTTNGGATWFGSDTTNAPTLGDHSGDPAPAITPNGDLYNSYLYGAGVGASRSTNMGTTWATTSVLTSASSDKNHTFVDAVPGSPYFGRVYVTWSDFSATSPNTVLSYTSNNGTSWTPPSAVHVASSGHYDQGVNGAVGPNGVAYIVWQNPVSSSPFSGDYVGIAKSTNGGTTWSVTPNAYDCNGARNSALSPWGIRINDFPSMAIDMTTGGRRGWIYVVTNEKGLAPAGSDEDIIMHRSTDGGTTWSPGIRVNQDAVNNGKKQYMPWMTVDDAGGLNVVYYDNRNSAAGDSVQVFLGRSLDGGNTWTDIVASDHKFKPAPISGLAGGYQGDYIGITAGNGKVWPYWMDNSSGIYQAWTTAITTTENFGWVKGTITSLGSATAVSGVTVDFTDPIPQVSGSSSGTGLYYAGARVDTPATTRNVTLRARKFGFVDTTLAVTLTRNDTVTNNFQIRPAPGGTLQVHAYYTGGAGLKAIVKIKFAGSTVVTDSTNPTTGLFSTPLPAGTYDVAVDPPSPYGTRNFTGVVISAGTTTPIEAQIRSVIEFAPTAVRDTLPIGASHTKTLVMTNTTPDTVRFRISDDNAIAHFRPIATNQPVYKYVARPKGQPDPVDIEHINSPTGHGGPDGAGYQWIDSDDPGGPVYSWVDISGTGTALDSSSAWVPTGTNRKGDEGYYAVRLPFSFIYYGVAKDSLYIGTNGNVMFQPPTGDIFTNAAFPTPGGNIDNHIGVWWDDLEVRAGCKVYYGANGGNFVVQYQGIALYAGTVPNYTFEIVISPNGQWTTQYLTMGQNGGTLISSSVGMENATGTIGLTVTYNAAYMHNNLAIRFFLPDAPWVSENPSLGAIAPNGNQNVAVTFDATSLTPGTTYNANIKVDAMHPDVASPYTVPASLQVQSATGPLLILSKSSITFPTVAIGSSKTDSLTARNGGNAALNISSITRTNTDFSVTPASANILPGDSIKIRVTYTPTVPAGPDTGRVRLVSNSTVNPTADVILNGNSIGVPRFLARVDSLTKTLAARGLDSTKFYVRNTGTMSGNFNARAVLYPRTSSNDGPALPIIIPMNVTLEKAKRTVASSPATKGTPVMGLSGSESADRSPFQSAPSFGMSPNAQFDLQFDYNALTVTGGAGNAAAVFLNNEFWTSRWASNVLHRWNANGTLIEQFTVTGVTGVRGLTTDGTFLYASTNTAAIYKINPVTKTLVSTITCASPVTTRVIAYDPVRDGFWVSNFADNLSCVNRSGAVIATMTNSLTAKYGGAYDSYTPGGPYLWVFDQTIPTGGTPQNIWQFNLTTLTSTGVSFDITSRITTGGTAPLAGGLFVSTGLVPGKVTIGGLLQGAPDRLFGLELANAGPAQGNWLAIAPPTGTIAVNDSTQFTATFDARSDAIVTNPGNYYGRIEITATNSVLADSLNIPVRLTVTPLAGAVLSVNPDSAIFGNVPIGVTDSSKTVLVKNIGSATLTVTNITSTHTAFSANRTSFTLAPQDTTRLKIRFTAPTPAGLRIGTLSFVSNDPTAPQIRARGTSIGQANIAVSPDSFYVNTPASTDTTRRTFTVRNSGTDTLRYSINETLTGQIDSPPPPAEVFRPIELGKGQSDPRPGWTSPQGQGGPDAFGYRWIDSDEPGGPTFSWVDISATGTAIDSASAWVPTGTFRGGDEGYYPVRLPFTFSYYGVNKDTIFIGSNGNIMFQRPTGNVFLNNPFPTATDAVNDHFGIFWDDLEVRAGCKVYYGLSGGNFVVQYQNIALYAGTVPDYTFEVVMMPGGILKYQYLALGINGGAVNSSTAGLENADASIGLTVAHNSATYFHNNLAVLISSDVLPWVSTNRSSGTIAPADSQAVQVRFVPNLTAGTYSGHLRVTGNTPATSTVALKLDVTGGVTASIQVTAPNGGENWPVGSVRQITWNQNLVDSVKIEYSTTGRTGSYINISQGVPARPTSGWIHPKGLNRPIEGSTYDNLAGAYNWTIPNTPSTNCWVRVIRKSTGTPGDTSNAAFTISAAVTSDTSWAVQPSGSTSTLYTVKAISGTVAWAAGAGGVVLRTTNGGTNWTSVGGGAIGSAAVYTLEAVDANTAFVSTTPSATFIYKTTNGGSTWTQVYTLVAALVFTDGIQMRTATEGYAVGDPVGGKWMILKTTDGGNTWARMATEPTQVGTEAGWNNSFQLLGNTMWFGTNASRIYRSTDFGVTWSSAATTAVNSYGVRFNTGSLGMIGGESGITNRSTNGGGTWAAAGAAGAGQVTGVAGVSGTEFWGTGGNNVYYSTNHGTAWSASPNNGYSGAKALWAISMVSPSAGSTYGWAVGDTGAVVRYRRFSTDVASGQAELPTVYALDQNFPNPFNPTTTIRFSLPEQSTVSLKIFNVLGQEVATLASGDMPAAFHTVVWSGRNTTGSQVASGIYFYRIEATGVSGSKFNSLKKLILLK